MPTRGDDDTASKKAVAKLAVGCAGAMRFRDRDLGERDLPVVIIGNNRTGLEQRVLRRLPDGLPYELEDCVEAALRFSRSCSAEISFSQRLTATVATPFPIRFVSARHSLMKRSIPTSKASD